MKKLRLPLLASFFMVSAVLFCSFTALTASQVNFSGKWLFNPAKSKAAAGTSFSGSKVSLVVVQNPNSIVITKTIQTPGGMVDTTSEEYTLDGKENAVEEKSLLTKRTGQWSVDKKRLVLTQTKSMKSIVFTTENEYTLSEDGKVLTIKSTETMNGKKGISTLVYEKK